MQVSNLKDFHSRTALDNLNFWTEMLFNKTRSRNIPLFFHPTIVIMINSYVEPDMLTCFKLEQLWQALSKTLAEKTAWALAMDRGVNMVAVNGGLLMSPDLTIANPYLKGAAEMYEDGVFVTVDLRFIVDTHIHVFEDIASYGRYLCFNHVINCNEDAVKLANKLLPPSQSSLPQRLVLTR